MEEKEPSPGFLGQNLANHQEPIPANAWDKIEAGLDKRKRRGFWYWLWAGAGLLLLAIGVWFWSANRSGRGLEEEIIAEKKGGIQSVVEVPRSPTTVRPSGNEAGLPQSASRIDLPASQSTPSVEEVKPKATGEQSRNVSDRVSTRSELGDESISASKRVNASGLKVKKKKLKEPRLQTGIAQKHLIVQNGKRAPTDLAPTERQPVRQPTQSENQPHGSIVNEESKKDEAGRHSMKEGKQASVVSTDSAGETFSTLLVPQLETRPDLSAISDSQNPANAEGKPSTKPDSARKKSLILANTTEPKPDSALQRRSRDPFWCVTLSAGIMQQNARISADNSYQVSASEVKPAYSLRLLIGRLWPVFKSFHMGVSGSLHLIEQSASVRMASPTSYRFGADSLSIIATTEYKTKNTVSRQTLLGGLHVRFQWKPCWSLIGLQGQAVVVSYKKTWPKPGLENVFEAFNSREIGIWMPWKTHNQWSLDFCRLGWDGQSIPVPSQNSGKNWIISLGFTRTW